MKSKLEHLIILHRPQLRTVLEESAQSMSMSDATIVGMALKRPEVVHNNSIAQDVLHHFLDRPETREAIGTEAAAHIQHEIRSRMEQSTFASAKRFASEAPPAKPTLRTLGALPPIDVMLLSRLSAEEIEMRLDALGILPPLDTPELMALIEAWRMSHFETFRSDPASLIISPQTSPYLLELLPEGEPDWKWQAATRAFRNAMVYYPQTYIMQSLIIERLNLSEAFVHFSSQQPEFAFHAMDRTSIPSYNGIDAPFIISIPNLSAIRTTYLFLLLHRDHILSMSHRGTMTSEEIITNKPESGENQSGTPSTSNHNPPTSSNPGNDISSMHSGAFDEAMIAGALMQTDTSIMDMGTFQTDPLFGVMPLPVTSLMH